MHDAHKIAIPEVSIDSTAYRLSPVGIEFLAELDQQGWVELGTKLGNAGRSIGFLLGDWLNYGEAKTKRGDYSHGEGGIYHDAIKITGLDYRTLAVFAHTSRRVQFLLRNKNLSFEHHRKVAPLRTDEEKQKWLRVAEKEREKNGKTMSSRRLAKSIAKGEVVSVGEVSLPPSERGQDNVHPHVNRIVAFWGKLKENGWLQNSEDLRLERMLRDLQPVVDIYDEIASTLNIRKE
jgi:hypothetical protein